MTGWVDEVEAAVDAVVDNVPAVEPALVREILLELAVYVANDRLEAVHKKTSAIQPRPVQQSWFGEKKYVRHT